MTGQSSDLRYSIHDTPTWTLSIFLGLQHYMIMFGSTVVIPLIMAPKLCMRETDTALSMVVSTLFFVSGMTTVLQATLGVRLPIIQGGTYSLIVPAFAILSLPVWKCPEGPEDIMRNVTTSATSVAATEAFLTEVWQSRMREVQGAIIVASIFQVVVGLSGVIGLLLRYIGPLSIAPTLTLIGLSLFETAGNYCQKQWGMAILTMFLLTVFSQYMKNIEVPCPSRDKEKGFIKKGYRFFELFPVLMAIGITWLLSYILTVTDVYPPDPESPSYLARTDSRISILKQAPWFRVPYPCQWGLPTVSLAGVLGMMSGILAGILESIGDYYACARISGAPPPPIHAVNRGIFVEGLGCIFAGLWGSGNGTTSYSENIGAINITRVGSRRVVQVGGFLMMFFALFGKFGALFVTIPHPIVGGILMATFGMITAVGISNLQFVNLNSSRNLFVFGFATFVGLSIPEWLKKHPEAINTGSSVIDQVCFVLGSTGMFVAGALGFILDNTMPGTPEERGLTKWRQSVESDITTETEERPPTNCYSFPLCMDKINRMKIFQYIPIMPPYRNNFSCKNKRNRVHKTEENNIYDIETTLGNVGNMISGKANVNESFVGIETTV